MQAVGETGGGTKIIRKRKLPDVTVKIPISELMGKPYVWMLFDEARSCKLAFYWAMLLNITIFASTTSLVAETVYPEHPFMWFNLDTLYISVFTFDLIIRMTTCPDMCEFLNNKMNWVDIITTVPYYVQCVMRTLMYNKMPGIARVLRAMRHMRLIRVTKAGPIVVTLEEQMKKSLSALIVPIFYMILSMVVLSALVYFIEMSDEAPFHPDAPGWNPYERPAFDNLPLTIWWCVVTMTGVGYGDLYPESAKGQVVAAVTAALGVFFIAMPFAVSGGSFWFAWNKFCDDKEIEDMMKGVENAGEEAGMPTQHEMGFQDPDQIQLLHGLYGISVPVAEMAAVAKSQELVDEKLVTKTSKMVDDFEDFLEEELEKMRQHREMMLVSRQWVRQRQAAVDNPKLTMPPKPDTMTDAEANRLSKGSYKDEVRRAEKAAGASGVSNPVFESKDGGNEMEEEDDDVKTFESEDGDDDDDDDDDDNKE